MATSLTIGDWKVDPSRNELARGAESIRLEPKAIEVLAYLAGRAGEVVGREELLNAVWPGVLPSKTDVVNQAIETLPTQNLLTHTGDSADAQATFKKKLEDLWDVQVKLLKEYQDRLPNVRRVLANVPVLIILDDHEVTDDWFISRVWRDQRPMRVSCSTAVGSARSDTARCCATRNRRRLR